MRKGCDKILGEASVEIGKRKEGENNGMNVGRWRVRTEEWLRKVERST